MSDDKTEERKLLAQMAAIIAAPMMTMTISPSPNGETLGQTVAKNSVGFARAILAEIDK